MSYVLKSVEISKKYNQQVNRNVVKSASITIEKGEIHVIEGKSGSGKSTFLSMLGGMENPSNGKVYYQNLSLYDLSDQEQAKVRGEVFGFVFQSFNLLPELTVKENIELPLKFSNKISSRYSTNEIAEELGILSHLHKKPDYLSGGEQQRVAIARALITSPEIIFADEPTGNLDQSTSRTIIDLLTKLSILHKTALIVVTHEKNLFNHPHSLYIMEDGVLKAADVNV